MRKLNIYSNSKNTIARILSNLAHSPFSYGGYNFTCVEAALQGIKEKNKKKREEIFTMNGKDAVES